jgi:hypothetical protein
MRNVIQCDQKGWISLYMGERQKANDMANMVKKDKGTKQDMIRPSGLCLPARGLHFGLLQQRGKIEDILGEKGVLGKIQEGEQAD